MAHVIVVGNEKGGSGKSTTAMHIATALARMGHRVGALDLDLRQRSLTRYLENRAAEAARTGLTLPAPTLGRLPDIDPASLPPGAAPDDTRMARAMAALEAEAAFVLIDCPGSHTGFSQMAHAVADTLVTPLNDSFVDFDLLARFDPASGRATGPSIYAEMVWAARQMRARAGLKPADWLVLRTRLGSQAMHNKRRMGEALADLSRRIGFRVAPGLSERVVFRELFPRGLTLLDLREAGVESFSMSHVAARQELRDLIAALRLPDVCVTF